MPDLWFNFPAEPLEGSDLVVEYNLVRPHCPDASYQIGFESDGKFGRRRRVGVCWQNRGTHPEPILPGANGHAEHNLTSRHAPEAPIIISVHSAWQILTRFLKKMPDLGVICPPSPFGGADPDREHKLTRPHCPDASYQIWFESARYFWRRRRFCEMLTDGRTDTGPTL